MKSKQRRLVRVATILLSLSSIALITLPASASVFTDSNPSGNAPGTSTGYIGGGNIACGASSAEFQQSTFVLCNDPAGDVWGSRNSGYTLCPSGFDVWRFYSESTSPNTVEGYTVSRAYQAMNCGQVTGEFTSPSHADTAVGDVENGAFINTPANTTQWPGSVINGVSVGHNVYYSTIAPSRITTNSTFAQYGASCQSVESAGNTAAVDTIFKAMAAGTATTGPDSQTSFANSYWTDYQNEGTGPARNYLMNLPEDTPTMSSPNWTLLANDYGSVTGGSPCASAYQFIPPTTGSANGVEGVCTMPVNTNTEEWENITKSTNGHLVIAFEQMANSLGGDRYVPQGGTNSTAPGSGSVAGGFFSTWRSDIAKEVTSRPASQPYVGSPYVDGNAQDFLALGSAADRTAAASTASKDATCIAFTSSIPAVNAPPTTTTTTKPGGTTTTTKPGTTTTTAPVINPPNSGPTMTVTPAAPILSAGGSLHPNQVTITVSPFACSGAGICDPDGIGQATLESVSVVPKITATGNYSDFWINGYPNDKPTSDGGGAYSFTLAPITAVGTQTYTFDFAYPTTPSQSVTFKVDSATATFLVWHKIVVGQNCTTTSGKGKGKTTTTLVTCVPVYGNVQLPTTFTPTIEPAIVTKVVSGTVTPKVARSN